jgi:CDP-6-deoxy-D-xylo-4-hexulose-3-dehydrase
MVNSGSSADLLVAHGLGPAEPGRNEILVPAVTWPTQVWSAIMAGYTVRLVDVDPDTLQMDLAALEKLLSSRTRAVFVVHALGNVGNMDKMRKLGVPIIEDCCEAMGSRWRGRHVGTFGQAAAFSFFFSHLLNTMEGGMVVCDDDPRRYRLWRSHGWEPTPDNHFWFPTWGYNIRPTELQGVFGLVQMGKVEQFKAARAKNYERLAERMHKGWLRGVTVLNDCDPAWHGFPLMIAPNAPFTKAELLTFLTKRGVENRPIIAGNFARQPAADGRVLSGLLPGADAVHERGFYIGLAHFDDPHGASYVGDVFDDFLSQ